MVALLEMPRAPSQSAPANLISYRPANPTDVIGLLIDDQFYSLSAELYESLAAEAATTGESIIKLFREEQEAIEELRRITPPANILLQRATSSGAPAYMAAYPSRGGYLF